ncbi:TPR domain-containing protein [Fusarium oxysporum f. sp. phaseoli]
MAALSVVQDAADTIPENHIYRSHIMLSLARLYMLAHTFEFGGRIEITIDGARWTPPWEDQAIDIYFRCVNDPLGNPSIRMVAAAQLMVIFRDRGEYRRGVQVGVQMLDILHRTNTRSLSRDGQQRITAHFSDLAVETCALSIQAGDSPARALELLELGRGTIMSLLIEDRSDISELAGKYPEQAARFEKLRDEINRPTSIGIELAERQDLVLRRDRQVKAFDEVLQEIRRLPGQERFFRGPTAEELQSRAVDGPIVVVNIAEQRSDAILVSQSGIQMLHLPALEMEKVRNWMEKEPTRWRTRRERGPKNNLYREFLHWLWKTCVEPILTALNLIERPPAIDLPRIWWIGSGLASFLPFHAAGDQTHGSKDNAFTYTISSYTPTIRALSYARERASTLHKCAVKKPELLVVLMPTTPDVEGEALASLTVAEELSAIIDAIIPTYTVQRLEHPSCKDVLEQLAHCDVAHFACHGVSETANPSNSYLILQRPGVHPESPSVADKLTVRDISQTVPGRPRIAYLSACSTAENRAEKLVDEVIHLVSGFQVAGFPHVIGALWPSDDQVSVKVAEMFYQRISAAHPADDRAIASALREAVMSVRDRFPRQPLIWAQYVHIGV